MQFCRDFLLKCDNHESEGFVARNLYSHGVNKDKKRTKNNKKQLPPRHPCFLSLFTFAEVFAEL